MDRRTFQAALAQRSAAPALPLPLLERHAAVLEQLPPGVATRDPEALARAVRAAQRLYALPAVTVGDGGDALLRAARTSGDPTTVLAAPGVAVVRDAFGRLRAVLRDHAAIAVVLPATARLVAEAGLDPAAAEAVLVETIRAFGEAEPDAFLLVGSDGEPDPVHDALGSFYGAPVLRVGQWTSPGLSVWPDLEPPPDGSVRAYLVTTPAEIRPDLAPATVRSRLAAVDGSDSAPAGP